MEFEGLQVAHALPGRVRLRLAKIKGNPALAREAQERLAQVPGIQLVEAKPGTGSLLVLYDLEELFSSKSLEILSETMAELFPEIDAVPLLASLASLAENPAPERAFCPAGITGPFKAINTEVGKFTGGLDLKLLVPLSLIFFGLRGLWATEKVTFPAWYDYLWFGFNSFLLLNRGLLEDKS